MVADDTQEVAIPCKILHFIFLSFRSFEVLGLDLQLHEDCHAELGRKEIEQNVFKICM